MKRFIASFFIAWLAISAIPAQAQQASQKP
jgi:hypothetical protein